MWTFWVYGLIKGLRPSERREILVAVAQIWWTEMQLPGDNELFFCIWSSCSPDFLEYITGAFCVCICFVDHQNNQKMYIFWVTNVITNITWQISCCSVQLHRSQLCLNKLKWSSEEATVYNYLEHSFEAWTLELSNARLHPSGRLPAINKRFQTVHASEQHWPIGSSLSSSCFEKEKYGLIWADSTSKV